MQRGAEVLVIGAGLAGLSLALRLAESGQQVTLLAKRMLSEGSSRYAQGGIAAVIDDSDSFASHITDTLEAGAGLCHRDVVDFVVKHAPENIQWLIERGVEFSRNSEYDSSTVYHLTREGGHSHRRVVHARDATGYAVTETLDNQVRSHPRITVLENHIAVDLIKSTKLKLDPPSRCLGVYALDIPNDKVVTLPAKAVVLATGGAAKAYLYTSNPDTSTGDGIAMAWRAGCRVANMEFVQFHPTCLYHPEAKSLLVSEAVRGEGGRLLLPDGTRFMPQHDPRGELAPRDIVARAIDYEMKRHGIDFVLLDISHRSREFILNHFPNIYHSCRQFGYDMTTDPLPVVPAAHYICGGVVTDLQGRTDLPGLYAVGECTCTGLHGANRLASNSLLECLVLSQSCSTDITEYLQQPFADTEMVAQWDESRVTDPDEQIVVSHNWDELRRFMWDYVGIVRTTKRLQRALHRINLLTEEIRDFYSNFRVSNDLIELRNLVLAAELIVQSALARHESRGLHYTLDYPEPGSQKPVDTVLVPHNFVGRQLAPSWPGQERSMSPAQHYA